MADTETGSSPLPYPKAAYFILAGYLSERFVYYGLFGGVVFYFQRVLGFTAKGASTTKYIIESLIYFAPILGAILSDTFLGKVRTVTIMCSCYVVGSVIFTLSSCSPIMTSLGLLQAVGIGGNLILGLSAGLMKAVYTSLGPDQFKVPEQRTQQQRYFYAFYWMINAGAFCGQLLTAQLRQNVQCFNDDCYFLPFSILCGLMVMSLVIFLSGRSRYKEAPPDNTLIQVIKCISIGVVAKFKGNKKPVDHWIDRTKGKFDEEIIKDVKQTLRVLLLFVTYPLFWSLFYQSSAGMIFQMKRLDNYIGGSRIPPEAVATFNPLLIITLIPIFDKIIYPICAKYNVFQKITTRMITGMSLSACSFLIYAAVNSMTEQKILSGMESRLQVYNVNPCEGMVQTEFGKEDILLQKGVVLFDLELHHQEERQDITMFCKDNKEFTKQTVSVHFKGGFQTTVVFGKKITTLPPTKHYLKNEDAEAKVRVIDLSGRNSHVILKYKQFEQDVKLVDGNSEFQIISPQIYEIVDDGNNILGTSHIKQDGVYDIVISASDDAKFDASINSTNTVSFAMTSPSTTNIFAVFPQFLILTIGEVLFSVSAMDFAYINAPVSMKSVMQAANLFAITVGLWFTALFNSVNEASGMFRYRASHEAATYAILMALNTGVFIFLSTRFNRGQTSVDNQDNDGSQINDKHELSLKQGREDGIDNPAFE